MKHKALNQLLCAAVVNGSFREALLRNPAEALTSGYYEHSFILTPEERELVLGIRASRIEDFAAQVYNWISGNGYSKVPKAKRYSNNGYKSAPPGETEPLFKLARVPVPA